MELETEILELLFAHFKSTSKVTIWMMTPNTNFGGSTPQRVLDSGRGEKLLLFIKRSLEGY